MLELLSPMSAEKVWTMSLSGSPRYDVLLSTWLPPILYDVDDALLFGLHVWLVSL